MCTKRADPPRPQHGWGGGAASASPGGWNPIYLEADHADTQRGTTREGVHLGAMAGTADMILRCYSGIETRHDTLRLHPVLPAELTEAEFTVSYRGQPITITVTHTRVTLRLPPSAAARIRVHVENVERDIGPGQVWEVALTPDRP
ncbi:glycosyl hydrolase family 65 protein [Nocardia cyriacigeorgica]|uniref:glycosyl hydrolase family 65 protein n=1 Tax=Nocardia cyriacigeorgica TaxID=135487 RepID=UPI003D7B8B22